MSIVSQARSSLSARLAKHPTLSLLSNLTLREIRSRYNRTALGRLWSLLNPLATIAVYAIIFGLVFRGSVPAGTNSGISSFALWIACGIIPWSFISNGILAGMGSLAANAGLLTKVYFPRHVLVTSTVLSLATTFGIELTVLCLVMGIAGGPLLLAYLPSLVGVVLINVAFVLGIALILSIAVAYFRDLEHIWAIFNQIWFYGSGIVFTVDLVRGAQESLNASGRLILGQPIPLLAVFEANPAYQFLDAYRSILFSFTNPTWQSWLVMAAWAVCVLGVGVLVFGRFQARIVEEL